MQYLYLVGSVICLASTSIFAGFFTRRTSKFRDSSALYSFLMMSAVFLLWTVLFLTDRSFDVGVLWYSLLFALGFAACNIGIIGGARNGPVSLTSLMSSISLVVVTIWGFFFWDSPVTPTVLVGLCLVVVALVLCLYQRGGEEKSISFKWLIFGLMALFGNAVCSIVQRTQQTAYDGKYGNMLMMFATFLSMLVCLGFYLFSDKRDTKPAIRIGWYIPVFAGVCNVGLNMFVMLMALGSLSPSLIYPTISVGGLILTSLFSVIVLRERLRPAQWAGIGVGIVATLLLSI